MQRRSVAALVVLLLFTATVFAADPKSGPIDLSAGSKHFKTTVGEALKLETDFHRFELGGKTSIAANGSMKNTSGKRLHGALYIAFFDKDKNLVASAARTGILIMPGKQLFVGNVLEVPPEQIDTIATYQITIYESDKEVGKK
jgi:hypothetical protein